MQFLKYLQRDDLNVTTILIHISGVAKEVWGLNPPPIGYSVKNVTVMYIVKNK